MGNCTYLFKRDGKIESKKLEETLMKINEEVFNNSLDFGFSKRGKDRVIENLSVKGKDDNELLVWWVEEVEEVLGIDTDQYEEREVSENQIEMRSVPIFDIMFWIQNILIYEVSERMELSVYDEGIGHYTPEKPPKDYMAYSVKRKSYTLRNGGFLKKFAVKKLINGMYNDDKKYSEDYLTDKLYEWVFIKPERERRNNSINDKIGRAHV